LQFRCSLASACVLLLVLFQFAIFVILSAFCFLPFSSCGFFLIVRSPLCFFVSFHVLRSNGCFCVLYVVYMFAACLLFSFCSYSVFAWLLCSACSLPALFVMFFLGLLFLLCSSCCLLRGALVALLFSFAVSGYLLHYCLAYLPIFSVLLFLCCFSFALLSALMV